MNVRTPLTAEQKDELAERVLNYAPKILGVERSIDAPLDLWNELCEVFDGWQVMYGDPDAPAPQGVINAPPING
jgi:hypothetical protein